MSISGCALPFVPRWIRYLIVAAAMLGIATCDLRWGDGRTFSLFYMAPVAFAACAEGVTVGCGLAALAGCVRLVAGIWAAQPPIVAGWNAGAALGLLVTVSLLVDAIARKRVVPRVMAIIAPGIVAGLVGALVLAALAEGFSEPLAGLARRPPPARPFGSAAVVTDGVVDDDSPPLAKLALLCRTALRQSRPLLVGSRDLSKGSCISYVRSGQLVDAMPQNMGDFDGGPGTTLALLLGLERQENRSPVDDLRWHQTRLVTYLDNQFHLNEQPIVTAQEFCAAAAALADRLATAGSPPRDLGSAATADESTWPGYCLRRLHEAVAAGDLERMRRWSRELESATFWLADLHRWHLFLVGNFRDALRFQDLAREPFESRRSAEDSYHYLAAPSHLPGGMLTLHGVQNFLELERQAELIFRVTPDHLAELDSDRHLTDESIRVPPVYRRAYLALAEPLGAANRRTLAAAAGVPYECSFLVNMLYRLSTAGMLPEVVEVLRRFEHLSPSSTPAQLMGVLVYRGHFFAGIEWGDRFRPNLIDEALSLKGGSDAEVFADACRIGHEKFLHRTEYGVTLSLRDAIDRGVIDCVRATDLVLDLFRNSGRSGVGHVRWAAGTAGHTVPALWGTGERVLMIDPLDPRPAESWPDAYFHGARWPEALRDNAAPFTAELFVRGLDSYVWAQGYVIRGAHAGTLVRTAIPYIEPFGDAGRATVFAGPYPTAHD